MTMNFFESWDLNTNFLIFLFFSEIRKRSYAETAQFQENFEVYIQALISQCLDGNFLDEVFNDADEYFVSNIEKVDSVTLLRKDKVMNGVGWTLRFQQALNTWPCLSDLGSAAVTVKLKIHYKVNFCIGFI